MSRRTLSKAGTVGAAGLAASGATTAKGNEANRNDDHQDVHVDEPEGFEVDVPRRAYACIANGDDEPAICCPSARQRR